MIKNLLLLILLLFSNLAIAEQFSELYFQKLPILHDGRVKPIVTFAKIQMERFSNSSKYMNMNPSEWLIRVMFEPTEAIKDKIFYINDKQIRNFFGIDNNRKNFDYIELENSITKNSDKINRLLSTEEKNLTYSQKKMLEVFFKVKEYGLLLRSLSLFMPLNINKPDFIKENYLSYYSSYNDIAKIKQKTHEIAKKGIDKFDKLTKLEQSYIKFSYDINTIENASINNNIFKIIPIADDKNWHSPWYGIQEKTILDKRSVEYMTIWQNIVKAYYNKDIKSWDKYTNDAYKYVTSGIIPQVDDTKLNLETMYYNIDFVSKVNLLYFVSLLFLLLSCKYNIRNFLMPMAIISATAHGLVILSRMIILERPPVGTLYESIVFIPLVISIFCILFQLLKRDSILGFVIMNISGTGLLFISRYYTIGEDSISLLIAVLNTNFWLATHVVCVTTGYAVSIITACLAHIYLFSLIRKIEVDKLSKYIDFAALVALFFTAFGTILGGIWADQSWGRFWGWDPKENGALLIVLWLVWLLHGRISASFSKITYMGLMALLNVVVAISWFGVNLLSIGLHSYGFTDKAIYGFIIFCIAEIALIAGILFRISINEGYKKYGNT